MTTENYRTDHNLSSGEQWDADVKAWERYYEQARPTANPFKRFARFVGKLAFGETIQKPDTVALHQAQSPQSYAGRGVPELNRNPIGTPEYTVEEASGQATSPIGNPVNFVGNNGGRLTLAEPSLENLENQLPQFGTAMSGRIPYGNVPLPPQEDFDFLPITARSTQTLPVIPPVRVHQ